MFNLGISIHALRKESDVSSLIVSGQIGISIHALRKESDLVVNKSANNFSIFQSTLSVRRATV